VAHALQSQLLGRLQEEDNLSPVVLGHVRNKSKTLSKKKKHLKRNPRMMMIRPKNFFKDQPVCTVNNNLAPVSLKREGGFPCRHELEYISSSSFTAGLHCSSIFTSVIEKPDEDTVQNPLLPESSDCK
jgi:hypothetical protein